MTDFQTSGAEGFRQINILTTRNGRKANPVEFVNTCWNTFNKPPSQGLAFPNICFIKMCQFKRKKAVAHQDLVPCPCVTFLPPFPASSHSNHRAPRHSPEHASLCCLRALVLLFPLAWDILPLVSALNSTQIAAQVASCWSVLPQPSYSKQLLLYCHSLLYFLDSMIPLLSSVAHTRWL